MTFDIERAEVENLRGYTYASLPLSHQNIVLVGPNNSGKTSIIRIIDWLINHAVLSVLGAELEPSSEIIQFLTPARETRNRARRLTLHIRVDDGRSHEKFQCQNGIAHLRLNLRQTPKWKLYLVLGPPGRGEAAESSPNALELLQRLRDQYAFIYIPSFRDGYSTRFRNTLSNAFRNKLTEGALHPGRGGAPVEYRKIKSGVLPRFHGHI